MTRIVVVGSLNMDLVVRTSRLPVPGETLLGRGFTTAPGGKGANQAVAAARLGAEVSMIGRVGVDDIGRTLTDNLLAAGVNTECLVRDRESSSGVALIQVDDRGQNTIVVVQGVNAHLSPADLDRAHNLIAQAQALIVQLEIPLDTVVHALKLGRAAGLVTVLNPAPARPLPPEALALADIIVPNETEAQALTGLTVHDWGDAERAAHALRERGAHAIVITLGAQGALAMPDKVVWRVLPFEVQAVDATAAGDAFVAALAIARAEGRSFEAALREASAAGALTTSKLGAQPALPTRAELDQFFSHAVGNQPRALPATDS